MEKMEKTQFLTFVNNDEVIIAGYGLQGNDEASAKRRLKFARFKTFEFRGDTILSTNRKVGTCPGRS